MPFKEAFGNIWDSNAKVIAILTNCMLKNNGELVMGAGIAREASLRYPKLAAYWGARRKYRIEVNSPFYCEDNTQILIPFPTKVNWQNSASLELICESTRGLMNFINELERANGTEITCALPRPGTEITCALPRPGCGYGGLEWVMVRKAIDPILDTRVTVWAR